QRRSDDVGGVPDDVVGPRRDDSVARELRIVGGRDGGRETDGRRGERGTGHEMTRFHGGSFGFSSTVGGPDRPTRPIATRVVLHGSTTHPCLSATPGGRFIDDPAPGGARSRRHGCP